jgi:hypothetical protein
MDTDGKGLVERAPAVRMHEICETSLSFLFFAQCALPERAKGYQEKTVI